MGIWDIVQISFFPPIGYQQKTGTMMGVSPVLNASEKTGTAKGDFLCAFRRCGGAHAVFFPDIVLGPFLRDELETLVNILRLS
jgi:hypothetical protein